jgi:hypothetical protein
MPSGYIPQAAIAKPKSGVTLKLTTKAGSLPTDVVLGRMP